MLLQNTISIKKTENNSVIELVIEDSKIIPFIEIDLCHFCGVLYYKPERLNIEHTKFKIITEIGIEAPESCVKLIDNTSFSIEKLISELTVKYLANNSSVTHTVDDIIAEYNVCKGATERINNIRRCM